METEILSLAHDQSHHPHRHHHTGPEEAILHWSGKFWEQDHPYRYTVCIAIYSYCVKYNQHVKCANNNYTVATRGSEVCSPRKFGETDALRLNLGAF